MLHVILQLSLVDIEPLKLVVHEHIAVYLHIHKTASIPFHRIIADVIDIGASVSATQQAISAHVPVCAWAPASRCCCGGGGPSGAAGRAAPRAACTAAAARASARAPRPPRRPPRSPRPPARAPRRAPRCSCPGGNSTVNAHAQRTRTRLTFECAITGFYRLMI